MKTIEKSPKAEVTVFHNLISEVAHRHFCHTLLEINTQGYEYQVRMMGGITDEFIKNQLIKASDGISCPVPNGVSVLAKDLERILVLLVPTFHF